MLSETLAEVAEGGREAFYGGRAARAIVRLSGGLLTAGDLAGPHAQWVTPLGAEVFGKTGWTIPPNSQGYLTLAALSVFEMLGPPPDPDRLSWWHLLIESYRFGGLGTRPGGRRFPVRSPSAGVVGGSRPTGGEGGPNKLRPRRSLAFSPPASGWHCLPVRRGLPRHGRLHDLIQLLGYGGRGGGLRVLPAQSGTRLLPPTRPSQPTRSGEATASHTVPHFVDRQGWKPGRAARHQRRRSSATAPVPDGGASVRIGGGAGLRPGRSPLDYAPFWSRSAVPGAAGSRCLPENQSQPGADGPFRGDHLPSAEGMGTGFGHRGRRGWKPAGFFRSPCGGGIAGVPTGWLRDTITLIRADRGMRGSRWASLGK